MNAGIDKVVFNYIQYVLLDINLAFIQVYFLYFIQLKFYFELSQNKCLFWLYFIFQRHGHPQKLNLGRKLAHYSLWFTIVCGGKPVFVPDWILCKNGKLNRWILLQGLFFSLFFLFTRNPTEVPCSSWKDIIHPIPPCKVLMDMYPTRNTEANWSAQITSSSLFQKSEGFLFEGQSRAL